MSRYRWILAICGAIAFTGPLPGCQSGSNPPGAYPPPVPITVALPYVEAVHFPSEVHAWQPFTIEFELSCAQYPDALRSLARPFAPSDLRYDNNELEPFHFVAVMLYRDVAQISEADPPLSKITFDIMGLSPGDHNISFFAARTRGEGGMQIQIEQTALYWLNQDPWPFRQEIPFTVLP